MLRKHTVNDDGVWRDMVYYSVLETEWRAVKARLEAMMCGGAPRATGG